VLFLPTGQVPRTHRATNRFNPVVGDERFEAAIAAFDAANADDPHRIVVRGVSRPKELAHADLMTEWVTRLQPDASEALLLAARAHHLRRWTLPRTDFPEGRAGYLRWRRVLHERHAKDVGSILGAVGYDEDAVAAVQALVAKRDQPARGVSDDPETRTLEDALALVFVETQLGALADQLDQRDHERIVVVVRQTLAKMSPAGVAAALALPLTERERTIIERAMAAS
jgi:hypothetical protein